MEMSQGHISAATQPIDLKLGRYGLRMVLYSSQLRLA